MINYTIINFILLTIVNIIQYPIQQTDEGDEKSTQQSEKCVIYNKSYNTSNKKLKFYLPTKYDYKALHGRQQTEI